MQKDYLKLIRFLRHYAETDPEAVELYCTDAQFRADVLRRLRELERQDAEERMDYILRLMNKKPYRKGI